MRRPDMQLAAPLCVALAVTSGVAALCAGCAPHAANAGSAASAVGSGTTATPSAREGLILQASEGERRVRRPPPTALSTLTAPFTMKVDRRNGGSPDFVMFYEEIPPGQGIAPHHHGHSDEIIFVHRGSGVASLGSRSGAVATGATIYIPPNTRVSLRNTGAEPLGIVSVFAKPGFDEYLRAVSVPEGQRADPMTPEELSRIRAANREHVVYERP